MDNKKDIKVLLVEDHPLIRHGIRRILEETPEIEVVGEADNGHHALEMAKELEPDVLICDIRLNGLSGIDVVRQLKSISPKTRSLILSAFDNDDYVLEAIASGASGYLLKTMDAKLIPEAVQRAHSGETVRYPPVSGALARLLSNSPPINKNDLSPREREILTLAARGLKNKEIAKRLNMSIRTVEGHFSMIYAKLSVSSRAEAISFGAEKGLIEPWTE